MASVKTYLDNILSAIYGKDVRQSIHDAIQQCYIDASEGITPDISVSDISGGHRVTITVETITETFDVMDGTSVISPVLLSDVKTTASSTQYSYTSLSIPNIANYNTLSIMCVVSNTKNVLTFHRAMGTAEQAVIDTNPIYMRGGFYVDWTNCTVNVRWVNGSESQTPVFVYFDKVVGVG